MHRGARNILEFFSGSSSAVNTRSAVRECVDNAFGEGGGGECSLLIVHTTMGHNFAQMAAAAREACPGAEFVGCTASGIIGREGVNEAMRAMAVMALTGDRVIAGIEKVFGADMPIFGATAADSGKAKGTFQFHGDKVFEQSVVLAGTRARTCGYLPVPRQARRLRRGHPERRDFGGRGLLRGDHRGA